MSALGELGSLRGKKPAGQKPDRGGGTGKAGKKDNKAAYLLPDPVAARAVR